MRMCKVFVYSTLFSVRFFLEKVGRDEWVRKGVVFLFSLNLSSPPCPLTTLSHPLSTCLVSLSNFPKFLEFNMAVRHFVKKH